MMVSIKAKRLRFLCAAAGLLVYAGAAAAIAWRHVPIGMEPEHWALLAAVAAPGWVAAGLVIAGLTDWVSQTLFQRAGFGLGLGIVFAATLLLNAGEGAGGIGRLVGIALGAFFCVGLGTCAVLLPIFYIRHRRDLRGQGSDAQGRAR